MNESEVHELKTKLLKCDKTVHIQQLGMQWGGPLEETLNEATTTKGIQSIFI